MEGTSSAITFDIMPQATVEEMITVNTNAPLPSYDETALCSNAFRIMRQMVNNWLREVSLHKNMYADYQLVHFYRWIRSDKAFLYDPALRRSLNVLMRKLFLQMLSEFQKLGCQIIYADFTKIVIHTGKKVVEDAIGYAEYIVQTIRNKELFHSIHLSYQESWKFLLWLDATNYAGIKANLPTDNSSQSNDVTLEMNWAISEALPDGECSSSFENFISSYIEQLTEGRSEVEALSHLSYSLYESVQKLFKMSGEIKDGMALSLINTVVKALSADKNLEEKVINFTSTKMKNSKTTNSFQLTSIRCNMLQLIGVPEFSDLAVWKEPFKSYTLQEVICKVCNHCRDLDLCKDKHRAIKDGK